MPPERAARHGPLERIALDWNRGAIPGGHGERVNPLDQTKESAFSQPEHALARFGAGAAFTLLPPASRFVLRGRAEAIEAAGASFGCALPEQSCRAAVPGGGRAALWLGPDEWLLLAPLAEGAPLALALEHAMGAHPHSLVEVSHRQIAIEVSGPWATAILGAGCPLDLDPEAFPVGMCSRTVLAKSEIVLWRTAPETFHLEVARSFALYVSQFLEEASREFRADAG